MRSIPIALIASGAPDSRGWARWCRGVARSWPDKRESPEFERISADSTRAEIAAQNDTSRLSAAVVVADGRTPQAAAARLADLLRESGTAGLVLVGGGCEPEDVQADGLVVRPLKSSRRDVASMLYALTQRQHAVRELQRNLHLAQSLHGGAAAEVERIHEELLVTARLQREFLPARLPVVEGLDSGVMFRPAGFVSGDIYDIARTDEHTMAFFLADAMGHGLPAALMTLFIAAGLSRRDRGTADVRRSESPAESLTKLNRALFASHAGPARIASAVCGTIDARTGKVTLASAGHPLPLLLKEGSIDPVSVSGVLLGVLEEAEYEQVELTLGAGETLLIYSDGCDGILLEDHADSGEDGGPRPIESSRVYDCLRRDEDAASLADRMDRVAAMLAGRSGSLHQRDDETMLVFGLSPSRAAMDAQAHNAAGTAA